MGKRLFVVADDENHLAVFDDAHREPGRLLPLFDDLLPLRAMARKAAKPDCVALLVMPAFAGCPHGALMAMGSGSRPNRERAALLALDAAAEPHGPARTLDLAPLLAPLHERIPDLNIEGAFIQVDAVVLLQRGNGGSAVGWVGAAGTFRSLKRLSRVCKVEGIAANAGGGSIDLQQGSVAIVAAAPSDRRARAQAGQKPVPSLRL